MAAALFDDLIDGEVLQAGMLAENLTVTGLAYARGTGHHDVRLLPCHGQCWGYGITSKMQTANMHLAGFLWPKSAESGGSKFREGSARAQ